MTTAVWVPNRRCRILHRRFAPGRHGRWVIVTATQGAQIGMICKEFA